MIRAIFISWRRLIHKTKFVVLVVSMICHNLCALDQHVHKLSQHVSVIPWIPIKLNAVGIGWYRIIREGNRS